jgi:hypothetical protein
MSFANTAGTSGLATIRFRSSANDCRHSLAGHGRLVLSAHQRLAGLSFADWYAHSPMISDI